MKMRLGYLVDLNTTTGILIPRITGGLYSHVIVIFLLDDGSEVYFESIWKKDETTQKTGVRGPLPISKIEEWMAEHPKDRQFDRQPKTGWLPLSDEEVERAYSMVMNAVNEIEYAKLQILQNWVERRLGVYIHIGNGSNKKWTCCEVPLRILPSRVWTYFSLLNYTADDFAPSGHNGPSIMDGVSAWIMKEGTIV